MPGPGSLGGWDPSGCKDCDRITTIYKPTNMPFGRGKTTTPGMGTKTITMVTNHLLNGMIFQVSGHISGYNGIDLYPLGLIYDQHGQLSIDPYVSPSWGLILQAPGMCKQLTDFSVQCLADALAPGLEELFLSLVHCPGCLGFPRWVFTVVINGGI